MRGILSLAGLFGAAGLAFVVPVSAAVVGFDHPAMDLWMYENAPDTGARTNAPIFGGTFIANDGTDDRMGQYVMGWNTVAAGIPAGLPAAQYLITKVTLKATHVNDEVFAYDSTYDSYTTYAGDPDFDVGRPIELYGLGLRNGFTSLAVSGSVSGTRFGEGSPYGPGVGEHTRNAFALSAGSPRADRDVSENVSEGFESVPFAIGITDAVEEGELVPEETEFTFQLNLAHPGIVAYLQNALSAGQLGLTLSSLHPSTFGGGQPGSPTYPRFYTRDYYDVIPESVPRLEIEYSIVPEPSAGQVLILAGGFIVTARAWRRRDYYT